MLTYILYDVWKIDLFIDLKKSVQQHLGEFFRFFILLNFLPKIWNYALMQIRKEMSEEAFKKRVLYDGIRVHITLTGGPGFCLIFQEIHD